MISQLFSYLHSSPSWWYNIPNDDSTVIVDHTRSLYMQIWARNRTFLQSVYHLSPQKKDRYKQTNQLLIIDVTMHVTSLCYPCFSWSTKVLISISSVPLYIAWGTSSVLTFADGMSVWICTSQAHSGYFNQKVHVPTSLNLPWLRWALNLPKGVSNKKKVNLWRTENNWPS